MFRRLFKNKRELVREATDVSLLAIPSDSEDGEEQMSVERSTSLDGLEKQTALLKKIIEEEEKKTEVFEFESFNSKNSLGDWGYPPTSHTKYGYTEIDILKRNILNGGLQKKKPKKLLTSY